ncbi:uncharacterized protein A4U43_C07F16120 [Asparagus officinalis]|uniref:Uncharacterized protein n=1 Tax=Asparagus officinalis TaxID=4686 RepID=A0A5P1ECB4_ASPOF|nr:uncharacterized protein A4U43_C07F16120 [Asparagus officinalis]
MAARDNIGGGGDEEEEQEDRLMLVERKAGEGDDGVGGKDEEGEEEATGDGQGIGELVCKLWRSMTAKGQRVRGFTDRSLAGIFKGQEVSEGGAKANGFAYSGGQGEKEQLGLQLPSVVVMMT